MLLQKHPSLPQQQKQQEHLLRSQSQQDPPCDQVDSSPGDQMRRSNRPKQLPPSSGGGHNSSSGEGEGQLGIATGGGPVGDQVGRAHACILKEWKKRNNIDWVNWSELNHVLNSFLEFDYTKVRHKTPLNFISSYFTANISVKNSGKRCLQRVPEIMICTIYCIYSCDE